jgi:copper resistance protein C
VKHRTLVLLCAAAALVFGSVIGLAPQARADTALVSADPADGATVTASLTRVRLVFLDPLSRDATFAVLSPSGQRVDDSLATEPQQSGGYPVTLRLKPLAEQGRYTVQYFTVATDGVPLRGQISFTYTASGGQSSSGLPVAALIGAPLLLLAATVVIVVLRRRASSSPARPPAGPPTKPASCPKCGASGTPNQRFCTTCGTPLR